MLADAIFKKLLAKLFEVESVDFLFDFQFMFHLVSELLHYEHPVNNEANIWKKN